jgi:tetratricopeptide (TPR) repeat protein
MNSRQLGMYFLNQKAYGRAEDHLRAWIAEHPDDCAAHMDLVWCFNKRAIGAMNRWSQCDDFYGKLAWGSGSSTWIRFVRAEQLNYEDREAESVDEYRAVIDAGLGTAVVRYRLGCALRELGRIDVAFEEFCRAYGLDATFIPGVHAYAGMLLVEGRLDRLEEVGVALRRIGIGGLDLVHRDGVHDANVVMDMVDAAVAVREAVAMRKRGEFREGVLRLLKVWRSQKANPWLLRALAYLFYRSNWLVLAKKSFSAELPCDSPAMGYANGLVAWYESAYEEALKWYTKAIDAGMPHALLFLARARVFQAMGDVDREQEDLERAYARQPWLVSARCELATNAYAKGHFEKVIELADLAPDDRALALQYDVSGAANMAKLEMLRLRTLLALGLVRDALTCVKEDRQPLEDENLRLARSMVLVEAGEVQASVIEIEQAISLDDGVVGRLEEADLLRLGRIQAEVPSGLAAAFCLSLRPVYLKQFNEARQGIESLTARYPGAARLWYHLGNLSELVGERSKAKDAYRVALSLGEPDHRAYRALCRLLKEEGDVDGLLAVFGGKGESEIPLEYAMDIAAERGDESLTREIAAKALDRGVAREKALLHLLRLAEGSKEEFAMALDALTEFVPVDYEGRCFVVQHYLETGKPHESVVRCSKMISEGYLSLRVGLMLGLGRLAEAQSTGERNT